MKTSYTIQTKILIFIAIGLLVLTFFGLLRVKQFNNTGKLAYETKDVYIGNIKISSELADSSEKQQLGLGKRDRLEQNSGMLFPYTKKAIPFFWMKNMLIPIDIIWISEGKVVGIEKNVPPLPTGTPDFKLPTYSPNVPIDYVLEVNAGFCDQNNIKVGDTVQI